MRWACALGTVLRVVLRIALAATAATAPGAAAQRPAHRASAGFQISPKPCAVDGVQGTCMFVWQCLNSPGKHIGMCVDTFMFGSCCSGGDVGVGVAGNNSTPAVLFSPPSPGNKYTGAASAHGASSSSYTTTSQKYRPAVHQPQQPPHQHVKLTARPTFVSSGSKPAHLGPKPAFETSGGKQGHLGSKPAFETSAGKPGHLGAKPAFETSGGKPAHLGMKPAFASQPAANSVHHSTGDKTGKPVGPPAPHGAATHRPHWGMSPPPSDETSGASASVLASVWTTSDRRPTSPVWHATTEPAFVTRPRPSSRPPQRVRPTRKPVGMTTTTTTTTTTTRPSPPTTAPTSTTVTTLMTTTMSTEMTTTAEQASTISASSVSASSGEKAVQCGVPTATVRPEMRIVGGKNAAFGGWPWQVSVRRTSFFGFSSTHRCGGAVLNEHWIATAGHCVDDLLTSQIRIRVGEHDFSSAAEPAGFVERGVARKVVHPKYNFFTYEYDLALVRLDAALDFAAHVAPICLPATDDLLIGENATVTGWGRLSEGGTLPSVLQEVSVPIVSNAACKSMFLRAGRHEFIPEIFLCAGHETGGRDSCQGDSGGPLQVRGKDGRYFLAGIISWGIGCAEPNLPGVCTRISKFVTWILDNVT